MYYEEYGTGPNTIVAVHGNLASSLWWKFLFPHIPDSYRSIAMDLRGCGKSTHTSSGYEILQFVDDIKTLAEKLELKQFHGTFHGGTNI
jgi:pimeloyl-ACP methyl ester carboxylesterase